MDGADRLYSVKGDHCMKISSPFVGFSTNTTAKPTGCTIASSSIFVDVTLSEPGWVRVDVAALVDGSCPLICD